ncbi:MAG: hypothetical protein ACK4GO_03565 [Gemmobacter sp.]
MTKDADSEERSETVFKASISEMARNLAEIGNFVIKATVTIYGAGVAGLLFATPGLIEHGCFSSKSAQISFLIIVFSIVLGVFFSLRVAARAHIDLYRAFERRGEASMSGSTEKAAGCGQFSYIVGSCVPAASAPVMHALSVVFWVSISFGFGVAVFVFSSDCFSAPS